MDFAQIPQPRCSRFFRRIGMQFVLVLALLHPASGWASQSVLLVLSHDSPPYQEFVAALVDQLSPQQWQLRTVLVGQYDPGSIEADLIVTVGTKAASQVLQQRLRWPVLSVLIPRQTFLKLNHRPELASRQEPGLTSAIYLEQAIDRQLQLAGLIAPGMKELGVVLGPSSDDQMAAITAAIEARGWQPRLVRVGRYDNPVQLIEQLADSSDALLAVPDKAEFNRSISKWLLSLSYRRNIPLIGFSGRYVDAGATAALFSSPSSVAGETADWLERWRLQGNGRLPPPAYPDHFEIRTNREAAESIGLTLPRLDKIKATMSQDKQP